MKRMTIGSGREGTVGRVTMTLGCGRWWDVRAFSVVLKRIFQPVAVCNIDNRVKCSKVKNV